MISYTINLKRSLDRRVYVNSELEKISFVENKYIEGVDGNLLSEEDLNLFGQKKAKRRYGRILKLGEIGCTLSHRRCYQALLESQEKATIIFEDDIIIRNRDKSIWEKIFKNLEKDKRPVIILLSGGYWANGKNNEYNLTLMNVYSAYYTHSYMLNRAAAEVMLSLPADYLADDWKLIKKAGIKLLAVRPHLVDQQWDGTVPSMIQNEAKLWFHSLTLRYKIKSYLKIIPCKILELLGLHERDSYDKFSQI